jgi:hypothetical protein
MPKHKRAAVRRIMVNIVYYLAKMKSRGVPMIRIEEQDGEFQRRNEFNR